MRERDLIEKIAALARRTRGEPSIIRSIGDDCAIVEASRGRALALTTDVLVEGVHFDLSYFDPYDLGWKAAACNLSDLAAVGATPRWALLDLAVPPGIPDSFWDRFSQGLLDCLGRWNTTLVGGDTASSPRHLVTGLTLIGEVARGRWLCRDGAEPGDLIFCSGYLGESACGLFLLRPGRVRPGRNDSKRRAWWKRLARRHLRPLPRVELGKALAEGGVASSCIDLSDGLATDLAHVCRMSGVGAILEPGAIPISRALRVGCRHAGLDPLVVATTGGEDFELLWTTHPRHAYRAGKVAAGLGLKHFCIGRISSGSGVWLKGHAGQREISFLGYEHET